MKALKSILKVKSGATNNLILHELRRCSVIAKVKGRQLKFFEKVKSLPRDTAVFSDIVSLCKNSSLVGYYSKLKGDNCNYDKMPREKRINESTMSMCIYYRE